MGSKLKKIVFLGFIFLSVFYLNAEPNAWKVGEVKGFKITALANEYTVITRVDDIYFNFALNDQETLYFVNSFKQWLELDDKYNKQLNIFQKIINVIHIVNDNIVITYYSLKEDSKMILEFVTDKPYKLSRFYLTKNEVSDIIKLMDDAEKVSAAKMASYPK